MEKIELTYKEALAEIEEILAKVEDNKLDIDELGEKVKRVSDLLTFCKSKLRETEENVGNILKSFEN